MKIYVVGNPLVQLDSMPTKLSPVLARMFPAVVFEEADPNENFIPDPGSVIIDTVEGITQPQWFDSIDSFVATKSVSAHDYDLGFHLLLLRKLNKLPQIRILGIPQAISGRNVFDAVVRLLKEYGDYYSQK